MRIFLYEYTCAEEGPDTGEGPSLRTEGAAMLAALQTTSSAAGRGSDHRLHRGRARFPRAARSADCSVIIAPEFDGLLAMRCRWVAEAGGRLLGPDLAAIRLAGDKLRWPAICAARSANPRVPVLATGGGVPAAVSAGVEAGRRRRLAGHLSGAAPGAPGSLCADGRGRGLARRGRAASLRAGTACQRQLPDRPHRRLPLLPAAQQLSADGRFRYLGGRLPLAPIWPSAPTPGGASTGDGRGVAGLCGGGRGAGSGRRRQPGPGD